MDSISRLRDDAFLVRRTQTARPFRVFLVRSVVRCARKHFLFFFPLFPLLFSFFFFLFPRDGLEGKLRKDQTPSQCLAVKRILSFSTLKHSPGKSKRENRENNEHLEPKTFTQNRLEIHEETLKQCFKKVAFIMLLSLGFSFS